MNQGKIVIIAGPSGVGKKTIWSNLIKDPKYCLNFSVSMTTRQKRDGEIDKKDYFFVSHEEFLKAINENKMIEWAEFSNNLYGTPKQYVQSLLNKGINVMLEIEIKGVLQVLDIFKDSPTKLLTIFIKPPSFEELKKRLYSRKTDSIQAIETRLKNSEYEISMADKFQYIIVNDDVKSSQKKLKEIFDKNLL